MGCQSEVYIEHDVTFSVCTHASDGTEAAADAAPTYRVYAQAGGDTPLLTGVLTLRDAANTTGFYAATIACTTANGFLADTNYSVKIRAVVDGDPGGISYDFRVTADLDAVLGRLSLAGSGTGTYTDTVTDGTDPVDGVRIVLYTDSAMTHAAYEAYTNAQGVFVMHPDPGTYYRQVDLAGYIGSQGVEVTVT